MSYFNSIVQNVKQSTSNNSTTPLNSGATFTGVGESTLGIVGIQVNFICDRNCRVYVDQSTDNANWDITDYFDFKAALGGLGRTVQATASYFRIRVTNTSEANATYLRLQVAMCPIVDAVPRTLDGKDGFFQVCVGSIHNHETGTDVGISKMGELRMCKHVRLVGTYFGGTTLDPNFWTPTVTNGGAASQASGALTLATNGAADGGILVQSVRTARYVSGVPNYFRAIVRVPALAGVGANVKRWGCFDANDGAFFSTDGTTLSVTCRKGTSDVNTVASGSFNGSNGLTYILDENVHTYEIYYENSSIYFYIDGLFIHKFAGETVTLIGTMHLKIGFENQNSGGATDLNTLECRVASINRLGEPESRPQWVHYGGAQAATVLKYGPGTLHRVVVNDAGGTSITLYDSVNTGAPANPICIIDPSGSQASLEYDLDFFIGLLVVVAGAGVDTTIVYE